MIDELQDNNKFGGRGRGDENGLMANVGNQAMTRRAALGVLLIMVGVVLAGCQRKEPSGPPSNSGPTADKGGEMDDPEMKRLNAAVRDDPARVEALWRRAEALHARDRVDLALRDYDAAIRLAPDNSALHDARGFARHMHTPRLEAEAKSDYDEAVRLNPRNHHALNNRAYLLATTLDDAVRDGRQAVADATLACELTGYTKPGYLDTLAVAYAEAGDFERAIQWQQKALEDKAFEREWGENARAQLRLFRQRKPYRE